MCISGPTTRWRCERMHSHDDGWTRADGRHGNANSTARHDLHGTSCKSHGHTGMSWICGQNAHFAVWWQCVGVTVWICCSHSVWFLFGVVFELLLKNNKNKNNNKFYYQVSLLVVIHFFCCWLFFVFLWIVFLLHPWYNRTGWLGIKHPIFYLLGDQKNH